LDAFRQGLSETGHTEGRNVTVEYHWGVELDRLPAMAADFVDRKVDLILAISDPAARIAKNTSSTIPIAFFISGDPVSDGLVASLARPGGNLTGVTLGGAGVAERHARGSSQASSSASRASPISMILRPISAKCPPHRRDDLSDHDGSRDCYGCVQKDRPERVGWLGAGWQLGWHGCHYSRPCSSRLSPPELSAGIPIAMDSSQTVGAAAEKTRECS
jgi:ABC transporter substrate binding protein